MFVELSKNEDPCVAKGHYKNVATIGGPQQPPNISNKNQECFALCMTRKFYLYLIGWDGETLEIGPG